jgi:hypothetical protein
MKTLIGIVYLVVGIIVASTHHYFSHVGNVKGVISAVLAILLWPLVLFGVNLHLGAAAKAHR